MPFLTSVGRALSAVTLWIILSNAQQCYYPDGTTSDDVPCSTNSDASCCGANSWCMDNGLCFRGGLVTRGSCTDPTWKSDACTAFCQNASPSSSVPVTPCNANGSFACGVGSCKDNSAVFSMSGSGSFVLRASQVQALVAPALAAAEAATSTSAASADPAALYTAAELAGVGCGLGVPLLFAIFTIIFLVYSRRHKRQIYLPPSPPDPRTDIRLQPPMRIAQHPQLRAISRDGSERGSSQYDTRSSTGSQPEHLKAWSERYRSINEKTSGPPVRVREIRVELDASQEIQPHRHELGTLARTPR